MMWYCSDKYFYSFLLSCFVILGRVYCQIFCLFQTGTSSWWLGGFRPHICFLNFFWSEGYELRSPDRMKPTWLLKSPFAINFFLSESYVIWRWVCLCLLFLLLITYFVDTVNTNSSLRLPRFLFFRNDCQNSSTSLLHSFRFQCTLFSLSIPLCSSTSSSSI